MWMNKVNYFVGKENEDKYSLYRVTIKDKKKHNKIKRKHAASYFICALFINMAIVGMLIKNFNEPELATNPLFVILVQAVLTSILYFSPYTQEGFFWNFFQTLPYNDVYSLEKINITNVKNNPEKWNNFINTVIDPKNRKEVVVTNFPTKENNYERYWIKDKEGIKALIHSLNTMPYTTELITSKTKGYELDADGKKVMKNSNAAPLLIEKNKAENNNDANTTNNVTNVLKSVYSKDNYDVIEYINKHYNNLSEKQKKDFKELINIVVESKEKLDDSFGDNTEAVKSFNELKTNSITIFEELSDSINSKISDDIMRENIYLKSKHYI